MTLATDRIPALAPEGSCHKKDQTEVSRVLPLATGELQTLMQTSTVPSFERGQEPEKFLMRVQVTM